MRALSSNLTRALVGAGLAVIVIGGCKKDAGRTPGTPPATAPAAPAPAAPGGIPAAGGAAPHGPMGTAPAAAAARVGAVVETMNSGGYTYAKLDLGGEQVWTAAPETTVAVGAKVQFLGGSLMTGFHSNTLDRTFDQIYFVSGLPLEGAATMAAPVAGGAAHTTAPAAVTDKIEPVAGGQSIAAMTSGAAGLAGKQVSVRGKVVKYNGGIMGKNWIHLQDGTGDMTFTTAATAAPVALGDVVVLRGTVAVGKDFGGGYTYAVIVEDAALVTP